MRFHPNIELKVALVFKCFDILLLYSNYKNLSPQKPQRLYTKLPLQSKKRLVWQ